MLEITWREALNLKNPVFVDVRAPVEYTHDHIPGALNIPLFDDVERSIIGEIYKNRGENEAIIKGGEYAGARLKDIISEIMTLSKNNTVVIHCFRGGMRSQSIVTLLSTLNIPVYKLEGGYKSYRSWVNERFVSLEILPALFVLHGLTGTGKTEMIRSMSNSIDLENMAGHRSSVFGALGLVQKSQKMFESLLLAGIDGLNNADYAIIEGESRKIGNIHVPGKVLDRIYNSPPILITATMERRVDILSKEYIGKARPDEIIEIIRSLENKIGRKNTEIMVNLIEKDNLRDFTQFVLEKYYDPLYHHTINKMKFVAVIDNRTTTQAVKDLEEVISGQMSKHSP
jgi:tRNA 2-selenouridine synthase